MQYRRPIYIQFLRFFLNYVMLITGLDIYLQHVQRMKLNEAWIESPYIMHSKTRMKSFNPANHQVKPLDPKRPYTNAIPASHLHPIASIFLKLRGVNIQD